MASKTGLRTVLKTIRKEAHPAPTFPPVDPALVTRTLRAAARSRRRRSWLTVNCGGPGSGKPGPCPMFDRKTSRYKILPLDEETSHVESHLETFGDEVRILDGVRDVALSEIDQPSERGEKYRVDVRRLAEKIFKSKSIRPIVVIRGKNGTYTLDGDHRVSAFKLLEEKSIPAVVIEERELTRNAAPRRGQFSSQRDPWRVTIRRLAPYLLDLMPDLTKGQAAGIARSIQLGLRSNASDGEVAEMIEEYDIEPERAALIARTEMARARADTELGRLKPNERVVYVLAPDACPKCVKVKRKYKERRLTAKQAQGIIPVHPNCYCRWKTVNVKSGREVTRNEVDPSVLAYSRLTDNVFCPTGPGGGVDPSCSSGKKIGEGNMGEVVSDGDFVLKNAIRKDGTKSREGEIYDLLKGVEGVAEGEQIGDKIRVRQYQEVLGIDAVPNERDRLSMGSVVGKDDNVRRLLRAFNALAEHGIDYNDHIQVGFDDDWKAHLLDFSNAGRNDPFQAETNNYSRLDQWLRDFGAEGAADNISDTYGVMKYLDFKTHLSQDKLNALKEKLKGDPKRAHLVPTIDKIKGKKIIAAYYSRNPRPVEETGRDIIQSDLSPNGLRMVFSTSPLDADTIRQYNLMPVVHRPKATRNGAGADSLILEYSRLVENVFCATGEGGGVDPGCSSGGSKGPALGTVEWDIDHAEKIAPNVIERTHTKNPLAGDPEFRKGLASGLEVTNKVPNTDSISATFDDQTTTELGVREVPMTAFDDVGDYRTADDNAKVDRLVSKIKENGWISPLIVVADHETRKTGKMWILEGGHRIRALQKLGVKSIPALVVVDHTEPS